MRKSLFILISIIYLHSNAQIAFQNLAVRKPILVDSINFKYTGAIQKFIVPNKVRTIKVQAIGATGGTGGGGQTGGAGANIITTLNVTAGQTLYIVVGGYPGQSATPKYGFAGNGGIANSSSGFGAAGGGLSGVFTSSAPTNTNALVIAGGGGGGSGTVGSTGYTGGAALNSNTGSAANGAGSTNYPISTRYQFGYGASKTVVGVGGYAFDNAPAQNGSDGSDINGGAGGPGTGWQGAGGGGAGYFGGGGGAGGGAANGGGGGGSSKSSSSFSSFGAANTSGDGLVLITCYSNSGLVLNLDAGNSNSYSGSGSTTWNDLTGISSNVTLTNTTYNSSNGGSIVFDGSTSYADFTAAIGNTNVVTVEMWVKTNSLISPVGMYFGFNLYDAWTSNGNIGYNTSAGDQYGVLSSQVDYLGVVGNWRHLVYVMYAGSNTNNKIYVNAESQSLSQIVGTFGSATSTFNSGNGRISSWRFDGNWKINMQLATFKVYNRELSAQEIRNNFNASSPRFYNVNDGLSPNTASTSAYQIKQDYPSSTDGIYWIKNGSINSGKPFKIYADMTTDGGGWMLVLNYLHVGNTNPALKSFTNSSNSLPLLGSTSLGIDESASTTTWGHAVPSLLNNFSFSEMRFYGKTSNHSRVIHFKTSHAGTLSYFKTGSGSMSGIQSSYTALTGHTANLPASASSFYSSQGDIAMTEFPFWLGGTYHWGIHGLGNRWEVDDFPGNYLYNTYHQIWIR